MNLVYYPIIINEINYLTLAEVDSSVDCCKRNNTFTYFRHTAFILGPIGSIVLYDILNNVIL